MTDVHSGDPMSVALEIERICVLLGKAADELGDVTNQLGQAEILYEDAFEGEIAVLVEEYEQREARLPGEEVRRALIHKRIDRELYRQVKRLGSRQDALEKYARIKGQQLSGLQSELSMLRAESSGPPRAAGQTFGGRSAA